MKAGRRELVVDDSFELAFDQLLAGAYRISLRILGSVAEAEDDVILTGLASQDPNVKIVGPRFAVLPYGIGIAQYHPDFVGYVNAMLEQVRANGTWATLSSRWLSDLGPQAMPPPKVPRIRIVTAVSFQLI